MLPYTDICCCCCFLRKTRASLGKHLFCLWVILLPFHQDLCRWYLFICSLPMIFFTPMQTSHNIWKPGLQKSCALNYLSVPWSSASLGVYPCTVLNLGLMKMDGKSETQWATNSWKKLIVFLDSFSVCVCVCVCVYVHVHVRARAYKCMCMDMVQVKGQLPVPFCRWHFLTFFVFNILKV